MENRKADIFLKLADSLSKYRRAELKNNEKNLIEELYVDPLDNDLILKSMLQENTTLLIGRKGTGKSTIINRFQHEIRKIDDKISLYIDVKALFEQAKKSSFSFQYEMETILSSSDRERLELYKKFIQKIIQELKEEIDKNIFKSKIIKFFTKKGLTEEEFRSRLDKLFSEIEKPNFMNITSLQESKENHNQKDIAETNGVIETSLSIETISMNASLKKDITNENISSSQFTKILGRYFDIIEFMNQLKKLLLKLPIKKVYICLDDMSEIDKDSMEIFTNFIIAPLNNLSDEYFKFKISLYPSRDFLPTIDRQKVKTFNLDYYDLYSIGNVYKIEESAILYTKKLIEKRFQYYYGKNVRFSDFFDLNSMRIDDYYKLLFQVSSNVPRIIGKILEISLHKTNSLKTKINRRIIQEASKQYYINDIEYILTKSEYIAYKSYNESFEQYHLLELLNLIIEKAIQNKKHIGGSSAKIFEKYTTNTAPSNYLYVLEEKEHFLKTLEFNFFITKYSRQKDKDGQDISIFSLNHGLCMKNNIIFDNGSDRKFRIERVFDFNKLLTNWINNSKELICSNCNKKYPLEQKDIFFKHKYPCLKCNKGKVILKPIINDIQKEKITKNIKLPPKEKNIKLPPKEDEILQILSHKYPLTATDLGNELERTYQSITHSISGINSKIKKYDFIYRFEKGSTPYFKLSDKGIFYIENGLQE